MRSERNSGNHRISQLPGVPLLLARRHKVSRLLRRGAIKMSNALLDHLDQKPIKGCQKQRPPLPGRHHLESEANLKNGNRSSPNGGAWLAIQPLNYLNIRLLTHKR
jgi:hypothetical protein